MTKESPASLTPEEHAPDEQLCEVCGRQRWAFGEQASPETHCVSRYGSSLKAPADDCYRLGLEREKARADAAEVAMRDMAADYQETCDGLDAIDDALEAEPKAETRNHSSDSAEVATLRLDVAWWRARVEAVEAERQAAQWAKECAQKAEDSAELECAEWKSRAEAAEAAIDVRDRNDNGLFMEAWRQRTRAEAAEAAQAKLADALTKIVERLDGDRHFMNPDGGAEMLVAARAALTRAASARQAPPEEVK